MTIQENVLLAPYTTFKIGGPARYFCSVTNEDELLEAVRYAQEKKISIFLLGGGSNLLISDNGYTGLVIKIDIKGISYAGPKLTAGAGELWDEVVESSVKHGLGGLENLSAIPGTVGATPVQNIGAYGTEAAEVIDSVRVLDTSSLKYKKMSNAQCEFAYRDSIFKHKKGRYVVVSVTFKLKKDAPINTSYRDLQAYFETRGIQNPTIAEVRQAVIEIRWGKLPDWKLWGTGGSYFKNPVITLQHFIDLKQKYPDLPGFPEADGRIKVSLGWILDKVCHMRGLCVGHVCTYEKQALVIVAQPGATSTEVVKFTHTLMKSVKEKTGIVIEAEVEWVN